MSLLVLQTKFVSLQIQLRLSLLNVNKWYDIHILVQGDERRAKATRRQDIPISENICGGMTPVELSQAQEKELQLAEQDTKMERTKDRKNSLESYVYDTRNKV